ncbi:epoxyqueuosine reductase QueH [Miniphocaeibacter halophilus]|uniref:Epoxyqueuosine reductase QueH n=1 Tax=Miniphocaeibacter halophilus TaxID=2931922 RepID=A0AC61MNB6_9FIRM|nr:epoxyqueuosine reductase QueH [Miniphocaeibacter halophilus]QQK07007.1 epoxyqueuosine reductase QueH [Miniphocaeibacter halophilus]
MEKRNYQKELEKIITNIDKENPPKLLLHSCCGPCSSYVLEYLSQYFKITLFYYNPNIFPKKEYFIRLEEQKKVIKKIPSKYPIDLIEGEYIPKKYYDSIKGYEDLGEGTERCFRCYEFRMKQAAFLCKKYKMDYFTTTLSISPYKNANKINEIGEKIALEYKVKHLPSDFKKKGGYQRSIELSKIWNLYRQDYCGCIFSKNETEERIKRKKDIHM